jgi:hypothetical protein
MNDDFRLPFFDPDYCLKVVRWASAVCVSWLLIELILLAVINPEKGSCSSWTIHSGKPSEVGVWFLVLFFTVVPSVWLCFTVVRWRQFSEKIYNEILERPALIINPNQL